MKKVLTLCLLLAISFAQKPFLEYRGTQIFSDTISYDDGYDRNGRALPGYNVHSELSRTYVFGYINLSEDSRIRISFDSAGFQKNSNGYFQNTWLFIPFLYYEKMNIWGLDSFKLGLLSTPWLNWEDKIWGYRFICRSFLADNGISSPQDRGLSLEGQWNGSLEYALTLTGGQGIFMPDIDGIITTELRLSYSLDKNIKMSLGGGSGTKAIDLGYPGYYSATYKYGAANIYYKAKPWVWSYTLLQTYRQDDDYVVEGIRYATAGETQGKGASLSMIFNIDDNWDWISRQDVLDQSIETSADLLQKSINGFGWHSGNDLRLGLTRQAVINESAGTATHTIVLNSELRF